MVFNCEFNFIWHCSEPQLEMLGFHDVDVMRGLGTKILLMRLFQIMLIIWNGFGHRDNSLPRKLALSGKDKYSTLGQCPRGE